MAEQAIPPRTSHPLRIFMAAGEVSGDRQAAYLAQALLTRNPRLLLYGSGGEKMREAGVDIRIHTSHYGSVGFQESLRFVRPLRRVMNELRRLIRSDPPDLALLVDNEGFNGLLAKFLRREGIPLIYYFPPQVWLWGEWRAKAIAQRATAIIPAFQVEAEIYRREGASVAWFGHPLIDIARPDTTSSSAFLSQGLDPALPAIALMPGSRAQEIERLAEPMLAAARVIKKQHPALQILLPPAAPHLLPTLQQRIRQAGMTADVHVITRHVYACLSRCELLILSSGTATLEAALLGIPMVVAYRVSPVTYYVGRTLIKSRFIAMPNILLDELVVPELLQHNVTAEKLASHALLILESPERAQAMRRKLSAIRSLLGEEGVLTRAAEFVLRQAALATGVRRAHAA